MVSTYELAWELAYRLHETVTFAHVKRVAEYIEEKSGRLGIADAEYESSVLSVALLHDILEDTPMTEPVLRQLFAKKIADAIVALTRKQNEIYDEYIERVKLNDIARIVKQVDIEDHLAQVSTLKPSLRPRYLKAREVLLRLA
jgi:(p)ppGpp synthase/HD superfamily hydrolase